MALKARPGGRAIWTASLQHRDFRLLWAATTLQSFSFGLEGLALGWLMLEMTDSPFMVGLAFASRQVPQFFLGLVAGTFADRLDRRSFLQLIYLSGSLISGILALVVLTDLARAWHVITFAMVMGCLWAFTKIVREAYTYDIVGPEHALNGMSLSAMGQRAGGLSGALAAGVIISTMGVGVLYLVASGTYIAAVSVLMATRKVASTTLTRRESVLQNLTGFVRLVRETRTLLILMLLTVTLEVFGWPFFTLLPVFARDVLEVGATGLGFMNGVAQAGGMLGLVALASLGDFRRKGMLALAAPVVMGLGLMAFSLTNNIFAFLALLAVANAAGSSADALFITLFQSNVPNEQRGRAMGSYTLSVGIGPVGHLSAGAVAGILGAPGTLLITGSILAFVNLTSAIGLPRIRRLA